MNLIVKFQQRPGSE